MKKICIFLITFVSFIAYINCENVFNDVRDEIKSNPSKSATFYSLIADTGQTECYNDTIGVTPCPSVGQDFYGQDAQYNKPYPISYTGPRQHPAYTNDYTTKDKVTGLVWRSCTKGWSGVACGADDADPNTYTWADALTACTALNSLNSGAGYADRKDWRLPNELELMSIVDYGKNNPSIDIAYFPNTLNTVFWSSSTEVNTTVNAWVVSFVGGVVNSSIKTSTNHVRCVAGP